MHDVPQTPPRILPVPDTRSLPEELVTILSTGWLHDGQPLNMPRTLAHHPRLLKRFSLFAGVFLLKSALPTRDREMLTLRATFRAGTEYYFGLHIGAAQDAGISTADVRRLTEPSAQWDGRDAVLVRIADELVADGVLTDATWDEAAALYTEEQLIEALMLPGFYRMVAGFVNTVRVQRDSGVPGWPTTFQTDSEHKEQADV